MCGRRCAGPGPAVVKPWSGRAAQSAGRTQAGRPVGPGSRREAPGLPSRRRHSGGRWGLRLGSFHLRGEAGAPERRAKPRPKGKSGPGGEGGGPTPFLLVMCSAHGRVYVRSAARGEGQARHLQLRPRGRLAWVALLVGAWERGSPSPAGAPAGLPWQHLQPPSGCAPPPRLRSPGHALAPFNGGIST